MTVPGPPDQLMDNQQSGMLVTPSLVRDEVVRVMSQQGFDDTAGFEPGHNSWVHAHGPFNMSQDLLTLTGPLQTKGPHTLVAAHALTMLRNECVLPPRTGLMGGALP